MAADGVFSFPTKLAKGAAFDVTVKTQPSSPVQKCTVSGGSGTIGAGDVTSVAVVCTTNRYAIGGTISGLVGTVVLATAGSPDLEVSSLGTFAFPKPLATGTTYDVKIKYQPVGPSQTCVVTSGSGTVTVAEVTDIAIACTTDQHTIGGKVSGLGGGTVMLQNKGADDVMVTADGAFTFPTAVDSGSSYAITVVMPPVGRKCVVIGANGIVGGSSVTNVSVTCSVSAPHCLGLAKTCGPAGTGDCCASAVVPAGTFSRSYDAVTAGFTDPQYVATLSDFRLDTYEIDVGRFRAFVAGYPANMPAMGAGKNPSDATDPGWTPRGTQRCCPRRARRSCRR